MHYNLEEVATKIGRKLTEKQKTRIVYDSSFFYI